MICLKLTPRDPVIARDGRPFGLGVGRHVKTVQWPYPSVLAGSLRTLMGKLDGGTFNEKRIKKLKEMNITGPFPTKNGELFVPAPKDIMFYVPKKNGGKGEFKLRYLVKRPFTYGNGEGCDLPTGLAPVGPTQVPEEEIEGIGSPPFWSMSRMTEWLSDADCDSFKPPPYFDHDDEAMEKRKEIEKREKTLVREGFLTAPTQDRRTHVKIDPSTLAAEEQMLFSTSGLAMKDDVSLAARVEYAGDFSLLLADLDEQHPLGGERRLVRWSNSKNLENAWCCPKAERLELKNKTGIRMVLAAPALFEHGWKPGWLKEGLAGRPPGLPSVTLKLVGAVIDRRQPISGWSLESNGPKPVRRLVPAGSVYFFRVEEGDPRELADKLWLQSVCDDPQDRCDGFGSALWGVWDDTAVKGGV